METNHSNQLGSVTVQRRPAHRDFDFVKKNTSISEQEEGLKKTGPVSQGTHPNHTEDLMYQDSDKIMGRKVTTSERALMEL